MRYFEILEAVKSAEAAGRKRTAAMRSFSLAQDRKSNAARKYQDKMSGIDPTGKSASEKRMAASRQRDLAIKSANAAMAIANDKLRDN